jgi:hypothetical protein
MTITKQRITLEEQEKILMVAENLIREPANWITGQWKCPLYETDGKGNIAKDEAGELIPARDANGCELSQYCVEGAVNEATLSVLGYDRALALGAITIDEDGEIEFNDVPDLGPTQIMGLDEIAFELYAKEMKWDNRTKGLAMSYNDGGGTHEGVLTILRTRLERVRAKLTSRKAA